MHQNLFSRVFSLLIPVCLGWAINAADARETIHHDLVIHLYPRESRLLGVDRMRLPSSFAGPLLMTLSKKAKVLEVRANGEAVRFEFQGGRLIVYQRATETVGENSVEVRYEGIFDDPFPVAPVNTENPGYGVTGVISEKGCFLQAGTGWYPEVSGEPATYTLVVDAPAGMLAVSAGKSLGHRTSDGRTISSWDVVHPVEALSLSVGRYVVHKKTVRRTDLFTYFFSETDHLSERYLEDSGKYIRFYEDRFGPYAFEKFAVVENFFPTGYGFPSYTLLGTSVLRLPFIIRTSLPHEIAHNWWGNGVYVAQGGGNWSEGLATYVADYLLKEISSKEKAREYRRQILRDYAALVQPDTDFPLAEFQARYDSVSRVIGYGKGAMLFHMVRREIGDHAFWAGLREVYRDRLYEQASWKDFQRAFERKAGRPLGKFFDQWLSRKAGPRLSLEDVTLKKQGEKWVVEGRVTQRSPCYALKLPIRLETETHGLTQGLRLEGRTASFQIHSMEAPKRLAVDLGFDTFRILHPAEVPPSVNHLKGSPSVLIVLRGRGSKRSMSYAKTLAASLGLEHAEILPEKEAGAQQMENQDVILVGVPENPALLPGLPPRIALDKKQFFVSGKGFERSSDTFFAVFPHPFSGNRVVALFLPPLQGSCLGVVKKITHYGKYGYLVFSKGRNRVRGIWPIQSSPLVYRWEREQPRAGR